MELPIQVTFHGMDASPALDTAIREKAGKLDRLRGGEEVRFEAELGEKGPQASTGRFTARPASAIAQGTGRGRQTHEVQELGAVAVGVVAPHGPGECEDILVAERTDAGVSAQDLPESRHGGREPRLAGGSPQGTALVIR